MDKKFEEALLSFKDVYGEAQRVTKEFQVAQDAYFELFNRWDALHAVWVLDTITEDQMQEYHRLSKEKLSLKKACDTIWDRKHTAKKRAGLAFRQIQDIFLKTYLSEYVTGNGFLDLE